MNKKREIVYKVAKIEEEGLFKSLVVNKTNHLSLRYALMEKTTPAIGKIFVFKDMIVARSWQATWFPSIILKCVATNVRKETRGIIYPRNIELDMVIRFWEGKKLTGLLGAEKDVYTANSIVPIEIVE